MSKAAMRAMVSGLVQGVGFRYSTQTEADHLGVNGYARNLADGRVEVFAVGKPAHLQALVDYLEEGPPTADVSSVTVEWLDGLEYQGFDIR